MKTSEILARGLEKLRDPNWQWVNHQPSAQYRQVCAFTAVTGMSGYQDARRALERALPDFSLMDEITHFRSGQNRVPWWNDRPARTRAEVEALFERAIAAEKAKEAEFIWGLPLVVDERVEPGKYAVV